MRSLVFEFAVESGGARLLPVALLHSRSEQRPSRVAPSRSMPDVISAVESRQHAAPDLRASGFRTSRSQRFPALFRKGTGSFPQRDLPGGS
eukprot:3476380-Rhodomonas_salina.3